MAQARRGGCLLLSVTVCYCLLLWRRRGEEAGSAATWLRACVRFPLPAGSVPPEFNLHRRLFGHRGHQTRHIQQVSGAEKVHLRLAGMQPHAAAEPRAADGGGEVEVAISSEIASSPSEGSGSAAAAELHIEAASEAALRPRTWCTPTPCTLHAVHC